MTGISPGQSYSSAFLPNNNHIIDAYLCTPQFYQVQSRRSCRCNSHQSDPCHRACNHPATWKYFRLKNILGHFFAFHVLTRPRFHKRRTLGRCLERTMGSSSRGSLTGSRFVLCLYSYLFLSFHAFLTVQESIFSIALTICRGIDWNSPDNTWWWQVTQDCSMSSGSVWWPGMYTLLLYLQWK